MWEITLLEEIYMTIHSWIGNLTRISVLQLQMVTEGL